MSLRQRRSVCHLTIYILSAAHHNILLAIHSLLRSFSDKSQLQIDSIIQRNSTTPVTPVRPQRREKIYCDKWIHEGVCAFTQMGCKYLHEMPTDKATQVSLGLNHGLPTWYRRAQMVDIRPSPPVNPIPPTVSNPNRLSGPWRRNATSAGSDMVQSGARKFL